MTTRNVIVTTDTVDLEQAPKSTTDAILANVKTSVLLKAVLPVAKDEYWDAVGDGAIRQYNRERADQHDKQARYKASRLATSVSTVKDAD
jgi:hypothetical protein